MDVFARRQLLLSAEAVVVVVGALALVNMAVGLHQSWAVPVITVLGLVATSAVLVAAVRHMVALARFTFGGGK